MKWPGSVTVFQNGVLVQDHWEMEGLSTHMYRRPLAPHATKLPLRLQDHGSPVRFRNIWIREIPSRYANTTHGGPAANEADVMALRRRTAEKLFSKINLTDSNRIAAIHNLPEVVSYDNADKYRAALDKAAEVYLAELNACGKPALDKRKGEIFGILNACDLLLRNKVIGDGFPLRIGLKKIISDGGPGKKR